MFGRHNSFHPGLLRTKKGNEKASDGPRRPSALAALLAFAGPLQALARLLPVLAGPCWPLPALPAFVGPLLAFLFEALQKPMKMLLPAICQPCALASPGGLAGLRRLSASPCRPLLYKH